MKVGIASDHAGYDTKEQIKNYLKENNYEVIDYGTLNKESTDYPKYAFLLTDAVNNSDVERGILICHTGVGMSIAANKVKGIRCAKVDDVMEAILCREHNNANIIALSARKNLFELKNIIIAYLKANFSNEDRHLRRINMIMEKENNDN